MRRTWMIGLVATGLCGAALVGIVWAANGYSLKCLNKDCGYTGECTLGPLMVMDSIDGYCAACDKWVRLTWRVRAGKAEPAPKPLGKVWDASTGRTLTLYACPTCKGPFLPVTREDMLKSSKYVPEGTLGHGDALMRCPKCGEPSLKMKLGEIYD
jgi:hypothetical protein